MWRWVLVLAVVGGMHGCGGSKEPPAYPPPMPPPKTLAKDTRAGGYVFAAGTELQLDFDGNPRKGTLAEGIAASGVRLPAGTVVWLDGGRVLQARPPTSVEVGGFQAAANAPIRLAQPGVWDTYEICLAQPVQVDGSAFPAGVFVEVRWGGGHDEPGRLLGRSEVDELMEEGRMGSGCR